MALADESAVRAVIPARLCACGAWGDLGEDLLRQSWALYQTPGLEQYLWKGASGEKNSKVSKGLTFLLIFLADLQSEVVFGGFPSQ